ncbi:hypothetical protein HBI56_059950 [Parastagonospora nodorum]|nr:hypothetical protein HBI09_084910 [Parastagonospora nodorum]KAH4050457.1 hypothetical protein HBH49_132740 [Parastagonospora nodorum]KAH4204360.1 hypothetical protein HBI95_151680 [Parastagonospora nodorum]KAH4217086.1 hypothetical protein HBI06_219880 [Parastagonospora nodorum]KAH4242702.1 hypothetical protein HBI05_088340 [Parastagonospora nodorum]
MSRQNTNDNNDGLFFKFPDWQELGLRSREAWQQRLNVRTRHWELYADPDDIRHEIDSGEYINVEECVESEEHVEPAGEDQAHDDVDSANGHDAEDAGAYKDVTDQPYELLEEVYDHLLDLPGHDAENVVESRDFTDRPYELPEEVYDHLLELPGDNIGNGLSEDFPASLIRGNCHRNIDKSPLHHGIDGNRDEEDNPKSECSNKRAKGSA